MRLNREQYGIVAEIKARSRRLYRLAMQAEKLGLIRDEALAEMYIDGQVAAQYSAMLWRQHGEAAREEASARMEARTEEARRETGNSPTEE